MEVDWFNKRRILQPNGNIPPAELEASYYQVYESVAERSLTQARSSPRKPGRCRTSRAVYPPILSQVLAQESTMEDQSASAASGARQSLLRRAASARRVDALFKAMAG